MSYLLLLMPNLIAFCFITASLLVASQVKKCTSGPGSGPGLRLQALSPGLGLGLEILKPKPAQARPRPGLTGQAGPVDSLVEEKVGSLGNRGVSRSCRQGCRVVQLNIPRCDAQDSSRSEIVSNIMKEITQLD